MLAVACFACASPGQEQGALVRGAPAGAWLVLQDAEGYRVAYAAADKPFSPASATLRGHVTAATTVGDGLVVFFRGGSYERYFGGYGNSRPGVRPDGAVWPADAVALSACAGENPDEFYALIQLGTLAGGIAEEPATATASAHAAAAASHAKEASQPASTSLPRKALPRQIRLGYGPYLRLLRYDGSAWSVVSTVQVDSAESVALLACREGQTYLLLAAPGRARLVTLAAGFAAAAAPMPPDGAVLDLVSLEKNLTLTWLDGQGHLWLAGWDGKQWSAPAAVQGDLPVWTGQKPRPSLGQSGRGVLAAWRDGADVKAGTISPEGKSGGVEVIDLQAQATLDKALDSLRLFIGAVMTVMFLLVFWSGQPVRTAPFSLPPNMAPARLPRRLAAAMIDLLPFPVAAAVVLTGLGVPPPSDVLLPTAPFVYASIAMTAAFLVYSIVMEAALGATVGKKLMGLRVVGDRGGRVTAREAVVRGCSKAIEMSFLPLLVFPVFTRYRQRLGDKMAWTAVVELRKGYVSAPPPPQPPPSEDESDSPPSHQGSLKL
jgi:uncharacterized RDD family membrane protein YckC